MTIDLDEDPFYDPNDTLPAFADVAAQRLVTVDRSDLERWAACPAQAHIVASGKVQTGNAMTASGQEVHDAFSGAITEYVESDRLDWAMSEFADDVLRRLRESRPDVQPDVLDAAANCRWKLADLVLNLNPRNILKYDGGNGTRSGQLAIDLPAVGIRYTSEVDFLHASSSKEVLCLVDWKSGQKVYDADGIWSSFQFQSHAALILENFPKVEAVSVRVFNTRRSTFTRPVEFERKTDLPNIMARIYTAGGIFMANRSKPLASVPIWPGVDKCSICDARKLCPSQPPPSVADDAESFVLSIVAVEAKLKAMKMEAAAYVDSMGEDIVTNDGTAFGRCKPPSDRRADATIYELTQGRKEQRAATEPPSPKPRAKRKAEKITDAIVGTVNDLLDQCKGESK
jgi:hypothetical protein